MTRKKFNKLRRALITKMVKMYDPNQKPQYSAVLKCQPDLSFYGSYAEAWDAMKPARDVVGM